MVLEDAVPFDAQEFAKRLSDAGIQSRPFFKGMHEQPVYRRMGLFEDVRFTVTERVYRRGVYLPSGQAITDAQIHDVVQGVRRILQPYTRGMA